jgi:hypothetical protein
MVTGHRNARLGWTAGGRISIVLEPALVLFLGFSRYGFEIEFSNWNRDHCERALERVSEGAAGWLRRF